MPTVSATELKARIAELRVALIDHRRRKPAHTQPLEARQAWRKAEADHLDDLKDHEEALRETLAAEQSDEAKAKRAAGQKAAQGVKAALSELQTDYAEMDSIAAQLVSKAAAIRAKRHGIDLELQSAINGQLAPGDNKRQLLGMVFPEIRGHCPAQLASVSAFIQKLAEALGQGAVNGYYGANTSVAYKPTFAAAADQARGFIERAISNTGLAGSKDAS